MALLRDGDTGAEMRQNANWLLIPLQDPEGAASSTFARMTESFSPASLDPSGGAPPEIWDYMRLVRDYADEDDSIDAVVSIHNVESDETANLSTPFADNNSVEATDYVNQGIFPFLKKAGFAVGGAQKGEIGASPGRLYGWVSKQFGALPLAYEVNDRYPKNRLSHAGLQRLGAQLGLGLARWCVSERGEKWHRGARSWERTRKEERATAYAEKTPKLNSSQARFDLLTKGF